EQIRPDTYVSVEAKADLVNWGQLLLGLALKRMADSDWEGAIAAAQGVPFSVSPPPAAQDLIWFTRARFLATDKIPSVSVHQQLWRLWLVLLHTRQIQADSPFYRQGQALLPLLEKQIQDLTQLQAASSAANLGQIPALQLAIQMARTIQPDRPQRLLAQTLIVRWQKNIQRIQDRPTLTQAQHLADPGKLPDLKAAIAQAKLIAPGRPLQPNAQKAIQQWTGEIQAIEDRPLLDQAKSLAKQRKLKAAIQTASKIRPDRSLYKESQASIQGWIEQIQITEDRPTLSRAKTLADRGNFSAAIDMAAQISSDRVLYKEAQAAIASWAAQQETSRRRFRRFSPRYGRYESSGPPFGAPPRSPF
ncbi:MAG: hypothetical protein WCA35_31290, partial [Kovacikia sp.]